MPCFKGNTPPPPPQNLESSQEFHRVSTAPPPPHPPTPSPQTPTKPKLVSGNLYCSCVQVGMVSCYPIEGVLILSLRCLCKKDIAVRHFDCWCNRGNQHAMGSCPQQAPNAVGVLVVHDVIAISQTAGMDHTHLAKNKCLGRKDPFLPNGQEEYSSDYFRVSWLGYKSNP